MIHKRLLFLLTLLSSMLSISAAGLESAVNNNNIDKVKEILLNLQKNNKTYDGKKLIKKLIKENLNDNQKSAILSIIKSESILLKHSLFSFQGALENAAKYGYTKIVEALLDRIENDKLYSVYVPLKLALSYQKKKTALAIVSHNKIGKDNLTNGDELIKIAFEKDDSRVLGKLLLLKFKKLFQVIEYTPKQALEKAVKNNSQEIILAIINNKLEGMKGEFTNPNITVNNNTLLYYAAENNYLAIVKSLLTDYKDSIEPNKIAPKYNSKFTPLMIASVKGHAEIVKSLLVHEKIKPNETHQATGYSAIFYAIDNDKVDVVKEFLTRGDIRSKSVIEGHGIYQNYTLLLFATAKKKLNIVKELLNYDDIKVNETESQNGKTALMIAAENGYLEIVKELLKYNSDKKKHKINPNIQIDNLSSLTPLYTALMFAVYNQHVEVVEALSECSKTNFGLQDQKGNTALIMATKKNNLQLVQALLKSENAGINLTNNDGFTPLMIASEEGYLEIVNELLKYNPQNGNKIHPNLKISYMLYENYTALMIAIYKYKNTYNNDKKNSYKEIIIALKEVTEFNRNDSTFSNLIVNDNELLELFTKPESDKLKTTEVNNESKKYDSNSDDSNDQPPSTPSNDDNNINFNGIELLTSFAGGLGNVNNSNSNPLNLPRRGYNEDNTKKLDEVSKKIIEEKKRYEEQEKENQEEIRKLEEKIRNLNNDDGDSEARVTTDDKNDPSKNLNKKTSDRFNPNPDDPQNGDESPSNIGKIAVVVLFVTGSTVAACFFFWPSLWDKITKKKKNKKLSDKSTHEEVSTIVSK